MQNGSDSLSARQLSYLDCELEIGPGSGRDYPVAVIRSPAGEARETLHFPFDELTLENHLNKLQIALLRSGGKRRRIPSQEERTVQVFGEALFKALLTGEVRSRYDVSRREAAAQNKGLRLKLRILPPELAALPWEFMYDSRQAEFVCLSRGTPVVRYPESPQPIQPLAVTLPLRILGMVSSPNDLPPLDAKREKQRMENAIKDLRTRGLVELTWLDGQTWRDLQRAMRGGPWHVFHFIGHGGFDRNTDEGLIALADEQGQSYCLNATQLGRLLADHRSLRLVLLNACEGARGGERDVFSSTASILVRRGIPAVLAMQYEITDRAAIEFSRAFYEALADEMPADAAVAEARIAVSMAVTNTIEWGTPVLYMRSPDGVLFNLASVGKLAALPERLREAVSRKQKDAKWLEQERREREAQEKAARDEAERLQQERREREALARAAKEAERKARERAVRERIGTAWARLRHIPPLVWVGSLVMLLLIGVLAVRLGSNEKHPLVPTATALVLVTKPSLTPLGVAAQTFVSSTFTPTPMPSSTLAATPTPTPTGTPTSTPLAPTVTRMPTRTSTPIWTPTPPKAPMASLTPGPSAVQLELVAPRDGNDSYRNPITFRWRGSLSAGQAYQVTVTNQGRSVIVAQSGLLTTQSWETYLPSGSYGSTGPLRWKVLVVRGGNVVAVSPEWGFVFDPLGGALPPPTK